MLGAIAGDVIESRFEFNNHRSRDFELFLGEDSYFTDDTALTVATAKWLLGDDDLAGVIIDFFNRYPHLSYGGSFYNWARSGGIWIWRTEHLWFAGRWSRQENTASA